MTSQAHSSDTRELLVGYDGSPAAAGAIEVGARLLPGARARIAQVWSAPFASRELRARLRARAGNLDELGDLLRQEGEAEARRLAEAGAVLAEAAGLRAEPVTEHDFGNAGFALARLAERLGPDAIVIGSRGLGGVRALLGSVSDSVVHYSPVPVIVVPEPLLAEEREAARSGPVLVAYDGSDGARRALAAAASLFAGRVLKVVSAGEPAPTEEALAAAGAQGAETLEVKPRGVIDSSRAVADALAGCAREQGASVIVVGSRGQSARREVLLGSVAMATLHHGHRAVLVVPAPLED